MDLEQLTKHQIVLLTLLVSFVTSIATGIVTVSLMDQAPPGVTRVINQIVEHTVERVVPTVGAPTTVTTEKTVVVKDDDLAAQSIASVQKAIVRITIKGGSELVARGVIIDGKGTTLTDGSSLWASGANEFQAILYSGERVAVVFPKNPATTTPVLTVGLAIGTSTGFAPASLADSGKLRLGQSVIRIGGTGSDVVGEGVIASLPDRDRKEVQATVPSYTPGSIIMTLFGEIIGLSTTDSEADGSEFYSPVPLSAPTATSNKSQS